MDILTFAVSAILTIVSFVIGAVVALMGQKKGDS